MRHGDAERKLGVKSAHRQAMLANLVSSLVLHDKIETTLPRAKELKRIADRIVTLTKRGGVHAMRRARVILRNRIAVKKAFKDLPDRFANRHGGYTRILKLGYRHGDSAQMAMIEYLDAPQKKTDEKSKKTEKSEKVKKAATSIKEKIFKKASAKVATPEKHVEKKGPPRKVPQQRAKKEG